MEEASSPSAANSSSRRKWDMSPEHQANVLTKIQAMANTLEKLSPERSNSQTLIKKLVKARRKSSSHDEKDHNDELSQIDLTSSSSSSNLERQIEALGIQNITRKGAFSDSIANGNDGRIVAEQFNDALFDQQWSIFHSI